MLSLKSILLSRPENQSLAIFRRQYYQRLPCKHVECPEPHVLRSWDVQLWIWSFVNHAQKHFPFPAYDRLFLKNLQTRIEAAVQDAAEPDIVDSFAELYVKLSVAQSDEDDEQYRWICYVPPWNELDPSQDEKGIYVLERPNVLSAAGATGHRTWEAALHLAKKLRGAKQAVEGKRVLELGAGTGLLSFVAEILGAKSVLATDGDEATVRRITEAAERNGSQVRAQRYFWGDDIAELGGEFDVVLAADVIFDPTSMQELTSTIAQIVRSNSSVIIYTCSTQRNAATLRSFEDALRPNAISYARTKDVHEFDSDLIDSQTGFFVTQPATFVVSKYSGLLADLALERLVVHKNPLTGAAANRHAQLKHLRSESRS